MYIGGYLLQLICEQLGEVKHAFDTGRGEFAGHTEASCVKQARLAGWTIGRNKRVICPDCNREKRLSQNEH